MDKLKVKAHSLLRRSEALFKTDMIYVMRGGFWLTLSQVVSSLASFALAVGFAHFASKATYGTYKYIMSLGGLISALSLTGLYTAVANSVARGSEGALKFAFRKNLQWSIPMLGGIAVTSVYYALHKNIILAVGLLIFGLISPLLASASLSDAFLIGKKDFRKSTITSSLATIFVYATTLVAALAGGSAVLLVLAYMLSSLVAELIIYLYILKTQPKNTVVDMAAMSYGTHISAVNVVNIIVDRIDSILAFHFLGPIELAVYSFAVAMPEQIKGLIKNISSLALPKYSAQESPSGYKSMQHQMAVITVVMIPVIGVYLICAPWIYKIFFPQYVGYAVYLSRIYALSLITAAAVLPTTYLQAKTATKELYSYNVIGGIVQIALMYCGASLYGLLGIVLAINLSRALRTFYAMYLVKKYHESALKV